MITSINKHLYDLIEKEIKNNNSIWKEESLFKEIKNNLIWYNKENK